MIVGDERRMTMKAKTRLFGEIDIADDKKYSANEGMYLCTFDVVYSVNYELDRISVKPSLLKKASKDARKYSAKIDKIISSCMKSDIIQNSEFLRNILRMAVKPAWIEPIALLLVGAVITAIMQASVSSLIQP